MQNQPNIPVIGGSNHGNSVQTDASTDEIEIHAQTSDASTSESAFTETYQRRRFYGEVFGEGFDCFVLGSDDETEQKELARWSIGQPEAEDSNLAAAEPKIL